MPHGPLPPGVYWRRRLFVLGTAVALVLLVVAQFLGNDAADSANSGPAGDGQAVQAAAEPNAEVADVPTADPKPGKKNRDKGRQGKGNQRGKGNQKPPVEVLPEPTGECTDSDVVVEPFVSGAVAGEPVTISLQLRTISAVACNWRLSANHVALKVSSDSDTVWASWQCPDQVAPQNAVVRRDSTSTIDVVWNARSSVADCGRQAAWAQPGTYTVRAAAFGGEPSDEVEFTISPRTR